MQKSITLKLKLTAAILFAFLRNSIGANLSHYMRMNTAAIAFLLLVFGNTSAVFSQDARGTETKDIYAKMYADYGSDNEITALRTRESKHFKNSDGSITACIASGTSLHYLENGKWNDISNEILSHSGLPGYLYENTANEFKTYYKGGGAGIKTVLPEGEVTDWMSPVVYWEGGEQKHILTDKWNESGNISGNEITFSGIANGISVRFTQNNDSRKMDLLLANKTIFDNLDFTPEFLVIEENISIPASWTLSVSGREINIYDEKGKWILNYPCPVVSDNSKSDDGPAETNGAITADGNNGNYKIKISVPYAWLKNNSRTYPVIIDPTTSYYPSNTSMWTGYQTTANGAKTSGVLRLLSTTYDTWAKFNISSIQAGSTVSSVVFNSYFYTPSGTSIKYARLNDMNATDPVSASASAVTTAVNANDYYVTNYYFGYTSAYYGWKNATLGTNANTDVQNRISQGWTAVGANWSSGNTATTMSHYGYGATNPPYLSITYTVPPPPVDPATPTSNSPQCGSVTITANGTAPGGEVWYWQGTSCGTSTSRGSGTTYTATSSGTYYIRSYRSSDAQWSTGCGSISVTVNPIPSDPTSTSASPLTTCDQVDVTLSASGSGTIYWFDGSCGSNTGSAIGSGSSFVVTPGPATATTYYSRNFNGACFSTNCQSITVQAGTTPSAPGSASATPSTITCGAYSDLSASSTGNLIRWYDAASGGTLLATTADGANFNVQPFTTTTYYSEAVSIAVNSQTFSYTGSQQTWTVPAGVTNITIDAQGAQGGGAYGGLGGRAIGTMPVTPGSTLYVYVGGQPTTRPGAGSGGFNGGGSIMALPCGGGTNDGWGGGGASDVRLTTSLSDRIIVAAGGGGTGYGDRVGGDGGGLTGSSGIAPYGTAPTGGTQTGGGNAGENNGTYAGAGSLGTGGDGGPTSVMCMGGGGGGGYYGGGGGYSSSGAGGSSWTSYSGSTNTSMTAGYKSGNGSVTISWDLPLCSSTTRTPVTLTVDPISIPTSETASPSSIACGESSDLSAVSAGNTIRWYDAASGGTLLGTSASGANFNVAPFATTTYYAEAYNSNCGSSSRVSVILTVSSMLAPGSATATPSVIVCGGTTDINATGSGNIIYWYDAPTGGNLISTTANGANYNLLPVSTTTYYAEAVSISNLTATFNNTSTGQYGSLQYWTVPSGVTNINIDAYGAQGGNSSYGTGGKGAKMSGNFNVTPGQTLTIMVGQQGPSQGNDGGGGGGTFVVDNTNTPLIIAGGGGGASYSGPTNGIDGTTSTSGTSGANGGSGGSGGNGGQSVGCAGAGGGFSSNGQNGPSCSSGCNGGQSFLNGGAGGCTSNNCTGGYGGGGGTHGGGWGGGGGGGYSGGGASTSSQFGGGGGGSYNAGTNQNNIAGNNSGNGKVIITYGIPLCVSATRTPVTVTVNPPAGLSLVTATPDTAWCGGSSDLNATSTGNTIRWYDASTGGTLLGTSASGANYNVTLLTTTTTYYAESYNGTCANPTRVAVTVHVKSLTAPSPATASPSTIYCGGSTDLSATGYGTAIQWYDASSGGTLLSTTSNGGNYHVTPASTTTYYAEAITANSGSQSFSYTGSQQTWTVPTGVTSITIDAYGAQGSNNQQPGGYGAQAQGTLSVTAGQTLYIYVGGQAGFNGGGVPGSGGSWPGVYGGGASDIRLGGTALTDRVIVAAGGGGGGSAGSSWTAYAGGIGGGLTGGNGAGCCGTQPTGGTQSSGGIRGSGCNNCGDQMTDGSLGQGGHGDDGCSSYGTGSGGGGGYYGGGGGESCGSGSAGGGGSSYIGGVTAGTMNGGVRSGNGQITISWSGTLCSSASRTQVIVTVDPPVVPSSLSATPDTVWCGSSSNLIATSVGNTIRWYDSLTGGTMLGTSPSGSNYNVTPLTTTTYYAESYNGTCANPTRVAIAVNVKSLTAPTPVTASPDTVICGSTSNLAATGYGSIIHWYDASSGGTLLGSSNNGANFNVLPVSTTTYYAEAVSMLSGSQTFNYNGGQQTFTVPAGITQVTIEAVGAAGTGRNGHTPGYGGKAKGDLSVTPGQSLYVFVGGQSGFNGGGWGVNNCYGGGASDIRIGGTNLSDRVIVAGGGGGAGGDGYSCSSATGHGGGGTVGANYAGGAGGSGYGFCGSDGGTNGGSSSSGCHGGGGGGGGLYSGGSGAYANCYGYTGGNGSLGVGGNGNSGYCSYAGVGGGGGGYYGGGGAAGGNCGAGQGGGGSSWTGTLSNPSFQAGVNSGDGYVTISWSSLLCTSASRSPVTLTVIPPVIPSSVIATPDSIWCGGNSNLSAISTGNTIRWYDSLTGGTMLGTSPSGSNYNVAPLSTTTYYAEAYNGTCANPTRIAVTVNVKTLIAPAPVTATPDTVTCGSTANLNATGFGNIIYWYDAPTGGNLLSTTSNGANYNVLPISTTTYYAEAVSLNSGSQTFNYNGGQQTFTVPAGVTAINVDAYGAQGGSVYYTGGYGGRVQATLTVTPGQTLYVYVGGQGQTYSPGFNGGGYGSPNNSWSNGGGGGATDIRVNGTSYSDRILVAGAGGGSGYNNGMCNGGAGGGPSNAGNGYSNSSYDAYYAGGGATQSSGGQGANGGGSYGSFGTGGNAAYYNYAGGGGGGYYGGGGGYYYGGGGGGSSWVTPTGSSAITHTQGARSGNGTLTISWSNMLCTSSSRTPVTVTVIPPTVPSNLSATPDTVWCGSSSNLIATSVGNTIRWYDSLTGGTMLGTSPSGSNYNVTPLTTTTYYAESYNGTCANPTRVAIAVNVKSLTAPTPVTASPDTVICGSTSNLAATGYGSIIHWYDASSGGTLLGSSNNGANFNVLPVSTTTYYAEAVSMLSGSQTFNYNGGQQTFTVPAGITQVTIEAVGAAGTGRNGHTPGYGGKAKGDLSVTPGQSLYVFVGGQSGFNGGGWGVNNCYGGGASDIRIGGTNLSDRVIVAGGGGGAGGDGYSCSSATGHGGGGTVGANYAGGAGGSGYGFCGSDGGTNGGSSSSGCHGGGGGGGGLYSGGSGAYANCYGYTGGNGSLGVGGNGNSGYCSYAGVGGGGGGYYGGGGAAGGNCGAGQGGGGSSWTGTLSNPSFQAGVNSGDGYVTISWSSLLCTSASRSPVTLTVIPPVIPSSVIATPDSIWCGGNSNLSAISTGNTIRWYDSLTGGTMLGTSPSGSNYNVAPLSTTTYYAEAYNGTCANPTRIAVTVNVKTLIAPAPVTATPDTVTCGSTANLNATGFGNIIYWYDAPTGGNLLSTTSNGANYNVLPISTTTYYAEAVSLNSGSQTFNYNGGQQTFTVPAGVTAINVDAYGAQGGSVYYTGGYGGRVQATLTVTPGQTLYVYVGGQGQTYSPGFNGGGYGSPNNSWSNGGGGGATDIRVNGTSYSDRILVAGAGGGSGYNNGMCNGGAGGGPSNAGNGYSNSSYDAYYAGGGATQSSGGQGANGGGSYGSFGTGGNAAYYNYAGGGGGGYYGGGGGYYYGGGGGGSSWVTPTGSSAITHTQGARSGNGTLTISWSNMLCTSSSRTPVTVTVIPPAMPSSVMASPDTIWCGGNSNLSA
ncbi:MAG: glycine-rich protein, partial [Bacteroidota bacterium]